MNRLRFAGLTLVALACGQPQPSPKPVVPAPVIHTDQFVTVTGNDTTAFELVTSCFGAIQSDVNVPNQRATIHYEMFFGSDLFPTNLNLAIWREGALPPSQPAQIARTTVRSDSIITDVWRGPDFQTQRHAALPRTFSYMTGYMGIQTQLVRIFSESKADSVRLFWVATRGHTNTAYLIRRSADSVIFRIDSVEFAGHLSPAGVVDAFGDRSGKWRITRLDRPIPPEVNERCAMGSIIKAP